MRTKNKTKIYFNTKTIETIPVEKIIAVTKQQPKEAKTAHIDVKKEEEKEFLL